MSAYSEEHLVLEALDDSHLAFEQLIGQYQYRVLRTIASIIRNEQAAQDVAQETFLSAWSNLAKLKDTHKFGRWLNQTEWSRDGKTIFYNFCHPDKEPEFFRIGAHDLETGEERELYAGGKGESRLVISPDGQELAFTFSDEGYKALMVIPTAGGEAREILGLRNEAGKSHEHVFPVAWTPDGRYLLFGRGKSSSDGCELWRISAEGGKSQKLMELKSGWRNTSLHPDGQRIAYAERGSEYHELWVMENLLTTFAADK